MKLELKHIAPYLPYGLKYAHRDIIDHENDYEAWVTPEEVESVLADVEAFPIFRPLSDLTKEIEHNGEKFVPRKWLHDNYVSETIGLNPATWSHRSTDKLFEWHFDVFGLIDARLAVDINKI